MIKEGTWVDFKGWRIWIYDGHKMTTPEKLKEANEIFKSGYLQSPIQEQLTQIRNKML